MCYVDFGVFVGGDLFTVAVNLSRCSSTKSAVIPGHEVMNSALIAWIHVDFTGLKTALWRYVTMFLFFFYS